jgi:magnesium transporter
MFLAYLQHYPHEAARELDTVAPEQIAELLSPLKPADAGRVVEQLTHGVAADTLAAFPDEVAAAVAEYVDIRALATLLALVESPDRERLTALLPRTRARDVERMLSYREGTAGNLMDPAFTSFHAELTVSEVLERLHNIRRHRVRDLTVVGEGEHLIGVLPLHEVLLAEADTRLRALVRAAPPMISANASREEVLEILRGSGLTSLPVVDYENRVIGVIRYDALVQAARDEAALDMQMMVGVSKEERALARPLSSVSKRLPWLNINLLTAFLAAAVVGIFEQTIAQFTALAVLLPVVAGQSGNTGAQAQAVTMRGLALKEIGISHWSRILWKELAVGAINGVAIAAVTMLGVFLWSQNIGLTMVIGLAMVLSMSLASVSGLTVPIVLTALKQDPAQSSSIVLTTITDVFGFLSFLGLATLLSGML